MGCCVILLRAVSGAYDDFAGAAIFNIRVDDVNARNTYLSVAALSGQTESVKALLRAGADVNTRRDDGMSPLNIASNEGFIDIVRILLDNGADIESRDNDGGTPLYNAVLGKHHDVVTLLIEHGAVVNAQQNNGTSPLMAACTLGTLDTVDLLLKHGSAINLCDNIGGTPLHWASYSRHVAIVQRLLTAGASVNLTANNNQSCLWTAACEGHVDVQRVLLSVEADVKSRTDDDWSPLSVASQEGHIDVVKLLVQSGAVVETRSNDGATPLYIAACHGHTEIVQFLIEHHADVNSQCDDGWSPLSVASQEGHIDVVKLLVQNGAEVETRNNNGATPLYWAAFNGHTKIVQFLIASGADVDAVDYDLESSVVQAAVEGHVDVLKTLIQHNVNINGEVGDSADPTIWVAERGKHNFEAVIQSLIDNGAYLRPVKSTDNDTALISAAFSGRINVVRMLVELGADIHARDNDNFQAIDIASYCGHFDIVRYLCSVPGSINCTNVSHFFAPGLSCSNNVDCQCNNALHLTNDIQHMRWLLENDANVEAENVDGLRPIHCAVRTGLVEMVELLIQHGANVDAADVYGNRPLHDAVCHGLNIVQILVHCGAKLNVQNVDGKTPLHIAVEREQSEVIMFLLDVGADVGLTDVWRNTPLHYLTAQQLTNVKIQGRISKQTQNYKQLLITNALGVNALLYITAHGITDNVNEQDTANSKTFVNQEDICVKKQGFTFLLELQQIKSSSKTKVYSCKESSVTKPLYADCYGNTPLHYAVGVYAHLKIYRVSSEVAKTIDFLLKHDAKINVQNNDGLTPLHVARGEEAIEACLQHADEESLSVVDKRGRNFWHLLFFLLNQSEVELAAKVLPMISASDARCGVDDLNRTPLHYACMRRNVWIAQRSWLAEEFIQKCDEEHINKQDTFGRTALHYAAMANSTKLSELLKSKKAADVTVRDKFGKTGDEYLSICRSYNISISHLRLLDTSSIMARDFRLMSSCIQQCFFSRDHNLNNYEAELRKLFLDLRAHNITTSYVLNTYLGCRFDYSNAICQMSTAKKLRVCKREEILTDDRQIATQPHTMFTAIKNQMENAMQCLAEEISHKESRFRCEVIMVGSAYEGTKIGCCDEFDFNFVLTDLSRRCEVCYSPESPPGFVLLKASTPEYDEDLFNDSGILNTRIVKFKFETLVKQILSSFQFCEKTGFEFVDPLHGFFLAPGTTSTKLNTIISLESTTPVNGYYIPHYISIDVVPALCIENWWSDDRRREDLCQTGDCLIVFTQPQVKYPWISWTEPHGFITFAIAESRLLRDSPAVIRAAFMVVKRMSKYFCQYELFSSHVIKTALFWCMDYGGFIGDCTSSHDSCEINNDELLCWVQKILNRLLCFAAQDYVPSYFMPKVHQPVWLDEKYLKQFHMRLYRHGLTYMDLFSLNEQQSHDPWLQRIKSLFVASHMMCWSVLPDDDELKLYVPSDINPLCETEVCTTLLPANNRSNSM